jgi:hypothetical protein
MMDVFITPFFISKSEQFLYPNFFLINEYNTICHGLSEDDMDHDNMTQYHIDH